MAEKIRKKVHPELPFEGLTPFIPEYDALLAQSQTQTKTTFHSVPSTPIEIPSPPAENEHQNHATAPPSLCPSPETENPPSSIHKHYGAFLEDYIEKIVEILNKFEEIKKRAESHQYKSNCAKVSGTVVSSTGAALVMGSLWGSPLTAGTCLVLGAGGAVMSVTGSLTNVLTDYIDYKTTTSIMEDIKHLMKEKEQFDVWMRKSLTHFQECIDHLMEQGISKEVAISTVIVGIAKGAIDIMEKPNNQLLSSLSTAVKLHRIHHLAAETLPIVGKTFHMTEKSFQFAYNILGLTGKTIPTLMKDFAKISGVLSVAFAMADISILIKDLCSDHPSVDLIDKVVEKLKDERDILHDLLGILKAVKKNKDGILERAMMDIQMIVDKDDLLKDFVIVNDDEFQERAGKAAIP